MHWEKTAYRVFLGKPEGNRLLQRPNHRQVHNVKVERSKKGWRCTGFIWVRTGTSGELVYTVMNLHVPWNVRKILRCTTGGFSRRAQLHLGTSFKPFG
jgi:hypothetical protein